MKEQTATVTTLETKLRSAVCKTAMTEKEFRALKTAADAGPFLRSYVERRPGVTITDVITTDAIWGNKHDFNVVVEFDRANDERHYSESYNVIYGASIGQEHDDDIHSIMSIGDACFLYLSDYDIVIVND